MEIISLYDFSGEALKPWAHAGYACYAYDIEHPPSGRMSEGIHYEHADLHDEATVQKIIARHKGKVTVGVSCLYGPCRERSGVVGTQA